MKTKMLKSIILMFKKFINMPKWSILILLFLSSASFITMGQSKKTFIEVDTLTYQLYLNGEWDKLVKEGSEAIESGVDYFYLRMRVAYAFFMKEKYRAAIPHYKKALSFNQSDKNALEYLLLCYEYSGRQNDALKLSGSINRKVMPKIAKRYDPAIKTVGLFYSYSKGKSEQVQQNIASGIDRTVPGIQNATNKFNLPEFHLSHRMGRSVLINHSVSYMFKNEFSYLVEDSIRIHSSPDQPVYQFNYGLGMQITLFNGFSLLPSYYYNHTKVPVYATSGGYGGGMMSGYRSYILGYDIEKTKFYSIRFQHESKLLKAGISYSYGKANNIKENQSGLHVTFFPLSNLKLYYAFDGYLQEQLYEEQSSDNFIHKHLLGFKVIDRLWIELSGTFPDVNNFYDLTGNIVYNSLERVKNEFNFRGLIPLKNSKATIITNIGFYEAVSEFVPDDAPLIRSNSLTYNNINISGGIIWKL